MLIVKARPLRVLDLTLSRSRSDQSSEKFSAISNILGEEDKKLFLEFNATGAATILEGDSGGPIYYEIINDDGTVNPISLHRSRKVAPKHVERVSCRI